MDDPVIKAMTEMARESERAPDLVAEGLVKSYGDRTVVNGMSMDVRCGEIVGLLGPNGAGKTTTFYMIVGLVKPNEGSVTFHGEDVTRLPVFLRARKGLGYLAQEASVFRKLSVWNNVMAILETLDMKRADRAARCEELLTSLDLLKVAKQPAYTLSGGERRKLEIARALVRRPSILMLDEPFAGVDPLAVHDIQEIVRNLRSQGLGIIITDHNVRETLNVVDRAYLVYDGRLLCEGTSDYLVDMSIEVTMRHSDVKIESLKEYALKRMEKLQQAFPKVTKITIVIDVDAKKHMYMAEVVANRLGETAVGAKEFSESGKSVIDAAAARAERQLLKMRVKARKGNVRAARAGSPRN